MCVPSAYSPLPHHFYHTQNRTTPPHTHQATHAAAVLANCTTPNTLNTLHTTPAHITGLYFLADAQVDQVRTTLNVDSFFVLLKMESAY